MSPISIFFLVLASLGTVYYILSTLALSSHFHHARKTIESTAQLSISILKPVSGLDAEAGDNFLTFFRQDYVNYEVLFGVLNNDDTSVPVILDATNQQPRASLYIGSELSGSNNKVRILYNLAKYADGEIFVITDADTRVTPDFLKQIAAPFADETVGVVTCMYRGINARSIPDALEGLHMTCIFTPGVACANVLGELDFGLGAAIAIRRKVLDEIGGFASIVDYIADDFQLGWRAASAGYKVILSDYIIEIVFSGESWHNVLSRELRWSRTTRASRPWGHLGMFVTFGFAWAMLFWLSDFLSPVGWEVLFGVLVIRVVTAYFSAAKYLGDKEFPRRIYLIPLRDLLSFGIWIAGYLSNNVRWRGRKLKIGSKGKMIEID